MYWFQYNYFEPTLMYKYGQCSYYLQIHFYIQKLSEAVQVEESDIKVMSVKTNNIVQCLTGIKEYHTVITTHLKESTFNVAAQLLLETIKLYR